ncbi:MAG TPA: NAD-dependent epimerase/dehydratase family protein [Hyphomonas sp.]|nr:NAD-dependent epimerase/dehydratase family protein [Hyphomonas sp.]MCC0050362.1 NAD-dependent epimerase/dehydratase family protein [Rhodobiaceae bacterium]MCA8905038.1 NAD-dependent epimerase/dehydratase family protein [Hyphomonas sp.]MCB9962660.1 NAD-dependent epimerase/dehydratase family protein [Hyphomonas sp.]MCB9970061.1 NAD-dependent epimerase/dehydratase family protein [Hyphomonas sp.]
MAGIVITGAAGFIGAHCCAALTRRGHDVTGVDNFNAYYTPALKQARVEHLAAQARVHDIDINDHTALTALLDDVKPSVVVHLAAQAGVRYSFEAPLEYANSNLLGQVSVLEATRKQASVNRLIYASSSSVYSGVSTVPFTEDMKLGTPKSLYAATKIADEVLSDTYSSLYGLDAIGLRFFTVYGPWGRPDMAYWSFADAILSGRPLKLFNHGNVRRDFTYIDDIVAPIVTMVEEAADDRPATPRHRVYNIGNHTPTPVPDMIAHLERLLGRKAVVELAPLPPGDMVETFADVQRLQRDYGFAPSTPLETGLERFTDWYLQWRPRLAGGERAL